MERTNRQGRGEAAKVKGGAKTGANEKRAPGPAKRMEMPDIFEGADKKKRPASVTIHRKSVEEVYAFFREVSNFHRFMKDISRVEEVRRGVFRWTHYVDGKEQSWETELVREVPPRCLAWRTREGSALPQVAALTFEPASNGTGTVVAYKAAFLTVAGKIMGFAEKLKGEDPDTMAAINLRRFKALMETGEVPTVEGQPSGREEAVAA